MRNESTLTFDEACFAPAVQLLRDRCRSARTGTDGLTDERYLRLGLQRVLGGDESGRTFVQALGDAGAALARTTWFDSLQSSRRLAVVEEVAGKATASSSAGWRVAIGWARSPNSRSAPSGRSTATRSSMPAMPAATPRGGRCRRGCSTACVCTTV